MTHSKVRFKEFELDSERYQLRRNGRVIKLERMPMELLILLTAKNGRLVTRQEMTERLWGSEVYVDSEHGINTAVRKLRQALRDDPDKPRFVETVTGKGYRFIAEAVVEGDGDVELDRAENSAAESALRNDALSHPEVSLVEVSVGDIAGMKPASRWRWKYAGWLGLALGVLLIAIGWYVLRPLPQLSISEYVKLSHDGRKKILVGLDRNRLYFSQYDPDMPEQMSISGGSLSPIPIPLPCPLIFDVSPDGSRLGVYSCNDDKLWSVGSTGTALRYLTRGDFAGAAWSPDGESFVYSQQNGEIYRVRGDWTQPQKLDAGEGEAPKPAIELAWSPDGQTIRFTQGHKLWEISAHGGARRQLMRGWNTSSYLCCGRWTPDGAFFLFLSGDTLLRSAPFAPGEKIWALDERRKWLRPPASEPVALTSGPLRWGGPFPSKDGRTVYARGAVLRGELSRYDARSGHFEPFLKGISGEFVTFSNDGKSVAYVSYPEGILWKANRDGSNPVQLTDPPLYPKVARFSPDGSRILFSDNPPNRVPLTYLISSAWGKPEPLLPTEKGPVIDASWSPDGRSVVFTSCECTDTTATPNEIKIVDLESRQVTTLQGAPGLSSPRWSPDGRHILALAIVGDPRIYDLKTKQWSVLPVGSIDYPTYSHDGRWIYFIRLTGDSPGVFRIGSEGGKIEKIVDIRGVRITGWVGAWFGLDPEDTPLVLKDVGSEDVYALPLQLK